MDLNFLSRLGLVSPGPGVVPANGSEFGAPDYAQPAASIPQAPNGPPVNLLEGIPGYGDASGSPAVNIAPGPEAPLAPSAMPNASNMLQNLNVGAPTDAAPAADPATRPARARSSIVDTIGRLADVFAKVGGADALYQPTLDARQDREIALGDHDRSVAMEKIKLTGATDALGDAARARLAQAVRGTQALLVANPGADISKIFPLLAARAGVDPAQAQELGGQLAANPQLLDGLAGFDDSSDKYGGNVVYGKDAQGNIVPFQMNLKGGRARAILPDGYTPVDPLKFVDTGNAQVGVDPRTGRAVTTLDKSADPNTVANNATRTDIARGNNRTAITIAGMPARGKPGTGTTATTGAREAVGATLDELSGIYGKLDKMGALVSPQRGAAGNVMSYLRASGPGQIVEGAIGTEAQTLRDRVASIRPQLMQQLAKATGMTGKQLDSNADVQLFMKTVTNPQSSYEANQAAIAGLRRLLATAPAASGGGNSGGGGNRALPPRLGAPAARPAARPASRPAPRKPAGKPTVSNW